MSRRRVALERPGADLQGDELRVGHEAARAADGAARRHDQGGRRVRGERRDLAHEAAAGGGARAAHEVR